MTKANAAVEEFALTPPQNFPPEQPAAPTMLSIIDKALHMPDLDVAKLQALLAMKERWDANEAKKAYIAAIKRFKANPPVITKTKGVKLTRDANAKPAYFYAPLDDVMEAIVPALNEVGITHAWDLSYEGERMVVTCVLTHEGGHSERGASMRGDPDKSGAKNPIQAEGSTLSYLQRYTLLSACGLAAQGKDDDGASAGVNSPDPLSDEIVVQRLDAIASARDDDELKKYYLVALKEAQEAGDRNAQDAYGKAKNKRYREIHGTVKK